MLVLLACLFTTGARVSVGQMGTTVMQMPSEPPSTMQSGLAVAWGVEVVVMGEVLEVVIWGALVTTVRMVVSSVAVGTMMVEKRVSVVMSAP